MFSFSCKAGDVYLTLSSSQLNAIKVVFDAAKDSSELDGLAVSIQESADAYTLSFFINPAIKYKH